MTELANDPPPSPMQIAHDLKMQAKALDGRHFQGVMQEQLCRSLRRGAAEILMLLQEIEDQKKIINSLEAAAEAEAKRYEDYVHGDRP